MNDILDIEIILKRKKYSSIYNVGIILIIIFLIIVYILFTYQYQTYYISKGKVLDNKLELIVDVNDIKYIKNNSLIKLDDTYYNYSIEKISEELIIDNLYNNYQYVYLEVDGLKEKDNYVYQIKIPKEKQILAKYLKQYF